MTQRALFQVIVRAIGLWLVVLGIRSFVNAVPSPWTFTISRMLDIVWMQLHRAVPELVIGGYLLCGGRMIVDRCFPERPTPDESTANEAREPSLGARRQFQVAVRAVGLWFTAAGISALAVAAYQLATEIPEVNSLSSPAKVVVLVSTLPEILIGLYLLNGAPWLVDRCFPSKPAAE